MANYATNTRYSHVLPECPEIVYSLRSRKHFKSLIDKTTDLNNRHFLIRALYTKIVTNFNFNFMDMPCFLHLP